MSMILDALTRAEHERQLENQPDLKFVSPVKPQKKKTNKIWLWVTIGLFANALVVFLLVNMLSNREDKSIEIAQNEAFENPKELTALKDSPQPNTQNVSEKKIQPLHYEPKEQIVETHNSQPLAMEQNTMQAPEIDRPLLYESRQLNKQTNVGVSQIQQQVETTKVKKGNVSFSATELTADDAIPIVNKPKLLIDQGETSFASTQTRLNSSIIHLRDLPDSSRNSLNQYEVNVHVFDDDPIRRFVLINMDKYKEGDRIVNNGPLVEEITPEGVVVDYGNGRALLPPK